MRLPQSIQNLISQFNKLPTIGPKTAERLVFYLINNSPHEIPNFAKALTEASLVTTCSLCRNITDANPCPICTDKTRDHQTICIVEDIQDLMAIESLNEYKGLYHILGGKLRPLEGIGPKELNLNLLTQRIKKQPVNELILALNPDLEGESTMIYLSKYYNQLVPQITRLAQGLPLGSEITYADDFTLSSALKSRKRLD